VRLFLAVDKPGDRVSGTEMGDREPGDRRREHPEVCRPVPGVGPSFLLGDEDDLDRADVAGPHGVHREDVLDHRCLSGRRSCRTVVGLGDASACLIARFIARVASSWESANPYNSVSVAASHAFHHHRC
jgi:hypothetical protein